MTGETDIYYSVLVNNEPLEGAELTQDDVDVLMAAGTKFNDDQIQGNILDLARRIEALVK